MNTQISTKKQQANWYVAATHWLTSGFVVPIAIWFVAGLLLWLLAGDNFITLTPLAGVVVTPLALWLGARYSARYLKRKYVLSNAPAVIKLSTIYLVVINGLVLLYTVVLSGLIIENVLNVVAFLLGVAAFHAASKKFLVGA